MVQGGNNLKRKASKARHANTKKKKETKKGQKYIPPKKPALIKQAAQHKVLTAKIYKSIEGQMVSAASSGKLTIMKNTMPEGSSLSSLNHIKPGKRVPMNA